VVSFVSKCRALVCLFQRIIDFVLAGLTWSTCLVYVDDVICFASSFEEHVERLGQVFARLSAAGLKLKPLTVKVLVVLETSRFSGAHRQPGWSGCRPCKVAAIVDWPAPRNVGEVRSFPDWRLTTEIAFRMSALLRRRCFT